MSAEMTEREKETLMSARQIGAFRGHGGMNVGYTLKGFLHCGAYEYVCVCPVLSHSHWWLLWIRRWPEPFRPEVAPPLLPTARLCKRRAEKERESYF